MQVAWGLFNKALKVTGNYVQAHRSLRYACDRCDIKIGPKKH